MLKHVLAAAALVNVAVPVAARAEGSVAGNWTTEFPLRLRVMNGLESSEGTGHARLTFEVNGDSVVGTWQVMGAGADAPPPPRKLRGRVADGKVRIQSEPSERVIRDNDGEQRIQMLSIYEFVVKGDTLHGTETVESVNGSFQGPSRPFVAVRERK